MSIETLYSEHERTKGELWQAVEGLKSSLESAIRTIDDELDIKDYINTDKINLPECGDLEQVSLGYNESEGKIMALYQWHDYYENFGDTHLWEIPIEWFDMDFIELIDLVKNNHISGSQSAKDLAINDLKRDADHLGYEVVKKPS